MEDKEFNLLREPWIKVLEPDLTVKEVSLVDALVNSREYATLAGEMPTQDVAVLRLLIACALTVFYRYDADGKKDEISRIRGWNKTDVLDRWEEYWEKGGFPENAVREYLGEYEDRFWLFHPEKPFFQVADLAYGTDYDLRCLYGNMKTSNNIRQQKYHFSMYEGEELERVSYSEAARWLVHLNGFGVNVKNSKTAPGTTQAAGVGRLGKLGLIYVDGQNLFELIMLNLVPVNPESGSIWGSPNPIWEQPVRSEQSIPVKTPDNLPQLYTLQSRRIMLNRSRGYVTSFKVMNGDHFPYEDQFIEPMTIWKGDKGKLTTTFSPKRHNPEVQAWREFPTIFASQDKGHKPGVVSWTNMLADSEDILDDVLITFIIVGMNYDQKSYNFEECVYDSLSLSSELLKSLSDAWINLITDEINYCQVVVDQAIRPFAKMVSEILNEDDAAPLQKQLAGDYYAMIDQPFRDWLRLIDVNATQKESETDKWEKISCQCAKRVVRQYLDTQGNNVFKTRETKTGISSIPAAYNRFLWKIGEIYSNVSATDVQRKEE